MRDRVAEIEEWSEERHVENRKRIAEAVDVVIGKMGR